MSNGARWGLFFILMITLGLLAFKTLESLPTRSVVQPKVIPDSQKYTRDDKDVPTSRATSKKSLIMKPTTVLVTKTPRPVVKQYKQPWKKKGLKGDIFYREITPINTPKLDVLLLHGRKFTSLNWVKTMHILAIHGYHVVAMDLPGHGMSTFKLKDTRDKNRGRFLAKFIRKVGLMSPVIVSPSASGLYALPYISALKSPKTAAVSGFVSIAVSGTDRVSGKDVKHFPPSLILRGSKDTSLGVRSEDFLKLNILHDHSTVKVIEDAGHDCYIDKPNQFHHILLTFLQDIVKQKIIN